MSNVSSAVALSRLGAALALCAAALAAPATASGLGVSYNVYSDKDALSDCQLASSVAFNNAGFKNVSTVKGKTGHHGAVFADLGAYQGLIVCDPPHGNVIVTIMGPNQKQTSAYTTKVTSGLVTH